MTDKVIELFPKKAAVSSEPLTGREIAEFKAVLKNSVDTFHQLSVYDKFNLYSANVNLIFILLDLLHIDKEEIIE